MLFGAWEIVKLKLENCAEKNMPFSIAPYARHWYLGLLQNAVFNSTRTALDVFWSRIICIGSVIYCMQDAFLCRGYLVSHASSFIYLSLGLEVINRESCLHDVVVIVSWCVMVV